MFKRTGHGFFYDMKQSIYVLFSFITIIGSLLVLYYLEKQEKEPKCAEISPKLLDFVKKYNYLMLVSSLASIIFMWVGIL